MEIPKSIDKIRNHPESHRIGMIASHLGIVRGNSRNGREVTGVEVDFDMDALKDIIEKVRAMAGIIEVAVEVNRGHLNVGDEIMFVAVGGDIRDNVFPALIKAVDLIKKDCSRKKEILKDRGES